jgi:hypothetical protein
MDKKQERALILAKALDFFKEKDLNGKEILQIINERNPTSSGVPFLSESYFSKFVNHERYSVGIKKLKKIVETLQDEIFKRYKKEWNKLAGGFTDVGALNDEDIKKGHIILKHLKGSWLVYTWDEKRTRKDNDKRPHVHMFKIKVIDKNEVYCETGQATFSNSKIIAIGDNKLGIELINSGRIIFMVIDIGNIQLEDHLEKEHFYFGYSDSGRYEIKAGVGMLEKTNSFEIIKPQTVLLSELQKEKPLGYFNSIIEKQFLVEA